jgi:hypothetical protein
LKAGGATTVKEATKALVKEGKIKIISRSKAEKLGLKALSAGKANEHLYSLPEDEEEILASLIPDEKEFHEPETLGF